MKRVTLILALLLLSVWTPAMADAGALLKQDEAKQYLGDLKAHFTAGRYVYAVFNRSHRDAMHGRFTDGVLFVTNGARLQYLKNKDGHRKVVVGVAEGREKDPVSEDAWRQKIQNILSDDNPDPYVFMDEQKKETAVLFVGRGTKVESSKDDKGRLVIELMVDGFRDSGNNRRRMH